MPRIPAFTLARAVPELRRDVEAGWRELLASQAFVGGAEVEAFERSFADYLGAPACAGVANGTDALVLALRALGVRPGDEVIVPAFSFAATATTVAWVGATPVFADVDPATLNLDPAAAARRVGERTVGVIGVHLYGRPFDVAGLGELCRRCGLWLLEDAAQAHGARAGGRPVGTFGELAAWSFYPSKNLGCFGDGGAVTGREAELVERVRLLRHHGQTARYRHEELGTNSRLDALQAVVLGRRLAALDAGNAARRRLADRYRERLAGVDGLALPVDPPDAEPVYHQLTVLTPRRDELEAHLAAAGVGTAIHYPEALHHHPALSSWAPPDDELPVSVRAAAECLCLPMFPELTAEEVDYVCEQVESFFDG